MGHPHGASLDEKMELRDFGATADKNIAIITPPPLTDQTDGHGGVIGYCDETLVPLTPGNQYMPDGGTQQSQMLKVSSSAPTKRLTILATLRRHRPFVWYYRWPRRCCISLLVSVLLVLGAVIAIIVYFTTRNHHSTQAGSSSPPTMGSNHTVLWQPVAGATWQIAISGPLAISSSTYGIVPDVGVYDIDMFENQNNTVVSALHALKKSVICYFSAGTAEDWRPDAYRFTAADLGNADPGWEGERYVDTTSANVRDIMADRIAIAAAMGCNAIDPDNVDGYSNVSGFDLTEDTAVDYVRFLSGAARSWGMACGLKNAPEITTRLLPSSGNLTAGGADDQGLYNSSSSADADSQEWVQFAVRESCVEDVSCGYSRVFVDNGRPVFSIEYEDGDGSTTLENACGNSSSYSSSSRLKSRSRSRWSSGGHSSQVRSKGSGGGGNSSGNNSNNDNSVEGFSIVFKKLALDGWVEYCDGTEATTTTMGGRGSNR